MSAASLIRCSSQRNSRSWVALSPDLLNAPAQAHAGSRSWQPMRAWLPAHGRVAASTTNWGISQAGNPRLRTTMIELAWMWVRYRPDSALSHWFRQRVGSERGRTRRISIVALARKLLIALSRYVTHGEIPAGAVMKPV